MGKLLEKLVQGRIKGSLHQLPDDESARSAWPDLWEWMTSTDAGEDHIKEPARLTVTLGIGEWSVSLTDESLGVSLSATSRTLQGTFEALQLALTSPMPAIRTWKGSEGALKKKKKSSSNGS